MRTSFIVTTSFAILALSACGTTPPPPYVPPDPSQPNAQLTFVPESTSMSRHTSEQLQRREVQCDAQGVASTRFQPLVKWEYSKEDIKPATITFPAGRNHFFYMGQKIQGNCAASFSANLEAGHRYELKLDTQSKGWLQGSRCVLAMRDAGSGAPVKLDHSPMGRGSDRLLCQSGATLAEAPQLSIEPVPGRETCASPPPGSHGLRPELCVVQGSFSHDVYVLRLDGNVVLKGIDDQTTIGIEARYKDQAIRLRCLPQNIFPQETPEATLGEVRQQLPNATPEEVAQLADLLGPGPSAMGIELGKH